MNIIEFSRGIYQGNVPLSALLDVAKGDALMFILASISRIKCYWNSEILAAILDRGDEVIELYCNDGCTGAPQDCSCCPLVQYMEFDDQYLQDGWLDDGRLS